MIGINDMARILQELMPMVAKMNQGENSLDILKEWAAENEIDFDDRQGDEVEEQVVWSSIISADKDTDHAFFMTYCALKAVNDLCTIMNITHDEACILLSKLLEQGILDD